MRICFFGYIGVEKKEGASLSLINVMEEMVRRDNEVFFVTARKELISQLKSKGVECIYLLTYTMRQRKNDSGIRSSIKYRLKDIINRKAIRDGVKIIRPYKFDIIHINGIDNHVGAAIAKKLGLPYYWHIRQFLQEDLGKKLVGEQIVMDYLLQANGVIGISRVVKEKYEYLLQRPVTLIYNGIPLQNYELGEVHRFDKQDIHMLLAGRITENKGQIEAVKALSILVKKGITNVYLILVGNAEPAFLEVLKKEIKERALDEYVKIIDYCDDLNGLRRQCDIGLVCSKNEAFGRITIEYMTAEMLTIGANTGGTLELISDGNTGLLYQQGNSVDLAAKIQLAINHREKMKNIASAGKQFAIRNFSIERVCDDIFTLYNHRS